MKKRFFNKKQRIALAASANWKCAACGVNLPESWHSDHIIPFSKSGNTDVINGQALCPRCNLQKGNSMNHIILRDWQNKALNEVIQEFSSPTFIAEDRAFLTQATPGGGKTIHGLSVFDSGRKMEMFTHLVVVVPSSVLVNQWQGDAAKHYGIQLKSEMLYNGMPDFDEYNGIVMTYAGMNENHEALRIFCNNNNALIIADEAHHLSEGKSWGNAFLNAFEHSDHRLIVTGTPWTATKNPIPFVKYGSDGFVEKDFSYSKKRAIQDRVCRTTEFNPMTAKNLEFIDPKTGEISKYETLESAIDDEYPSAYQKTIRSIKHMKPMFIEADLQLTMLRDLNGGTAGGLVVAPDIQTAHAFQNEIFMLTGMEYPIVHSLAERPQDKITAFRKSTDRWLISVDMITEGVDIKRLQVCVFLSRAKTELFLRQVIGRIERIRSELHGRDVDQTAFFYYTDHPEINKIVEEVEEENKIGEELRDAENDSIDGDGERKKSDREDDIGFLQEVTTEHNKLIAEGFNYPEDVVAEAIIMQRADQNLFDVPLRQICKIIMSINRRESEPTVSEADAIDSTPVHVKKKRIRNVIQKEIVRKIGRFVHGKPTGVMIRHAHFTINKMVGMRVTNGDTSMSDLERKLQFIGESEAASWDL